MNTTNEPEWLPHVTSASDLPIVAELDKARLAVTSKHLQCGLVRTSPPVKMGIQVAWPSDHRLSFLLLFLVVVSVAIVSQCVSLVEVENAVFRTVRLPDPCLTAMTIASLARL